MNQHSLTRIKISTLFIVALMSCNKPLQYMENYRVININMHDTIKVVERMSNDIIERLIDSKRIGACKGMGINLKLASDKDTVEILSYAGSKLFRIGNNFYKSKEDILPDSIRLYFMSY